MAKSNLGIQLYLDSEQVNGLLYVLDCIIKTESTDRAVSFARRMKSKIYDYGRPYKKDEISYLSLNMYETDFAIMIKLLTIFISSVCEMKEDYFLNMLKYKEEKLKNEQAAENVIYDFSDIFE